MFNAQGVIPSAAEVRMEILDGTRVIVTGATSGLGFAMADALAVAGAHVVATSRSQFRAEETAAAIGHGVVGLAMDVRSEGSVAAAVDAVWERFGAVDLLVNNAGIGMRTVNPRFPGYAQPFWEVPPEGFRDVFETKVVGVFLVARAIVPRMLEAGSGRVVNISMNEGTMTNRGFVPYGPSGAAVEALSRIMAVELADSPVRVNMLLPGGATATGMVPDEIPDDFRARLLDPAIMGPPIVWLASPAAAHVHNERIIAREFDNWLAERVSE
jgi:NAD(P)-dependent dehydrogenase (short-subunit alcohol dehydrogenase family)